MTRAGSIGQPLTGHGAKSVNGGGSVGKPMTTAIQAMTTARQPARTSPGSLDAPGARILVLRGGAVGDCLLSTPMLAALKNRWPGAHLTVPGCPATAEIFAELPGVDQIEDIDKAEMPRRQYRTSRCSARRSIRSSASLARGLCADSLPSFADRPSMSGPAPCISLPLLIGPSWHCSDRPTRSDGRPGRGGPFRVSRLASPALPVRLTSVRAARSA
jgi:hypothetical protein